MVLGLNRIKPRMDNNGPTPIRNGVIPAGMSKNWHQERGALLFEAQVDVIGGFPGFADRGCWLTDAQFRVTEHFVLVDEGLPHGFGLPLKWIEGSALIAQHNREDYGLRIFYRDGIGPRLFTLRFRASRIAMRGVRRSVRAQDSLHAAGLADRFSANPPSEPSFTLPWDQTSQFEGENVIWMGRANAPIRVGREATGSDIWLTTKSLIWGSGDGLGVNRVPLPLLMDVVSTRLRDRLGTPAVYVGIGDENTGRFEIPFVFDALTPPDRNFRERGAFLVGLRSRGVPEGFAAPYCQPWRLDVFPAAPQMEAEPSEEVAQGDDPYGGWPTHGTPAPEGTITSRSGGLSAKRMASSIGMMTTRLPGEDTEAEAHNAIAQQQTESAPAIMNGEATPSDAQNVNATNAPQSDTFLSSEEVSPPIDSLSQSEDVVSSVEASDHDLALAEPIDQVDEVVAPVIETGSELEAVSEVSIAAHTEQEPDPAPVAAASEASTHESESSPTVCESEPAEMAAPPISDAGEPIAIDAAETLGEPNDIADRSNESSPLAIEHHLEHEAGVIVNPAETTTEAAAVHAEPMPFPDEATDIVLSEQSSAPEMAAESRDVQLIEQSSPDSDFGAEPINQEFDSVIALHGTDDATDRLAMPPGTEEMVVTAASAVIQQRDPWPCLRRYEEQAVGVLSDALSVIDRRVAGDQTAQLTAHAPNSLEQSRAITELADNVREGIVTAEIAKKRRDRLMAIGDVCVRLRTLIELHTGGYMDDAQLDKKRVALIESLSSALAAARET